MAHYAFLSDDNIVVEIITGIDETELIEGLSPEEWYGNFHNLRCVRTSYNGSIRKNYAGIGYRYNEELDAFVPPKPFDSWILNNDTANWEAPVAYPDESKRYFWNENKKLWEEEVNDN